MTPLIYYTRKTRKFLYNKGELNYWYIMGTQLLSAYELASKRIIVSKYAEQCLREEKRQKEMAEEIDALPEFIDAWERPDKGESITPLVDLENETRFYTAEEIKQHNRRNDPDIKDITYMTPLQDKQAISYGEPPLEVH